MAHHVRFALFGVGLSVAITTTALAATNTTSTSPFARDTQCGGDGDGKKKLVADPQRCGNA